MMGIFNRTFEELKENAINWWPEDLKTATEDINVVPLLLHTQDQFLDILTICTSNSPFQIFDVINATKYPSNLFLKHLIVLSDYGGEPIQRLGRSFTDIFPTKNDKYYLDFKWRGSSYSYEFQALPTKGLNNKKLLIDGDGLLTTKPLDSLMSDMIAILLFASASKFAAQAGLEACMIGNFLGCRHELNTFVKQRYIAVSKIIGGANSNNLGQLAQSKVFDFLTQQLEKEYRITKNGSIVLDGYEKKGGMPFDLVIEKGNKKVGIEISFQVTTNSTIERKAGQSADRQAIMHKNGYGIAYILDGAGNFQRSSAISTICKHSDCTVAYKISEFQVLVEWIKRVL